jgi:hypothetical protein
MFIPSFSVLAVGIVLAALLMAADWFVWGLTYANRAHRGSVRPLGGAELADRFLHRLVAVNESVLPCAALYTPESKPDTARGDDDGGFKRVA